MTIEPALQLLMVVAAVLVTCSVILMMTMIRQPRVIHRWSLVPFYLGMIGGALLTFQLATRPSDQSIARTGTLNWLTSPPHSFELGLESDWVKACGFACLSLLAIAFLSFSKSMAQPSISFLIAIHVLYCALATFLFAPNLEQSLLSWAIATLMVVVLFQEIKSARQGLQSPKTIPPFGSSAQVETTQGQWAAAAQAFVTRINNGLQQFVIQPATQSLPAWFDEQRLQFESNSVSLQLMTAGLGMFAILLTWLSTR